MPHKRNPVAAMVALAAAQRMPARVATLLGAMGQAHERGLGDWKAEIAEWPGLWMSAHGALAALLEAMQGLQVDAVRMLHNLAEFGPLEDPPPPAHLDAAASLARRRIQELRAQNAAIVVSAETPTTP
jgi:3-carboxy-cis,cis-muconate cycloisomerase